MADFNIQPVATQIKPVQGMSLGEMINAAGAAQAYRQAQQLNPIQLERAQAELQRLQQLTPEEVARAIAERKVSEETVAPRIGAAKSTAAKAETEAAATGMEFAQAKARKIADAQIGMINDPLIIAAERGEKVDPIALAAKVQKNAMRVAEDLGISKEEAMKLNAPYMEIAQNNPAGLRQYYKQRHLEGLDQSARTSAISASGVPIATGGRGYVVQTGEFGPVAPGTVVPGTLYAAELPPATEITTPTGERRLLGPVTQRPEAPSLTTSLPSGQTAIFEAQNKVIKEDLPKVIAQAADAPARIAIFQNIKKLAPDAFTGPTAERRQMIASFAQMIGIPAYEMETATTDELLKNTNLLALAGGNTDAAREIARFANPNNKMTKEGIVRVTNQLISIEEMNLARARYMGPAQNDPVQYFNRKQQFDQIADPRLFLDVDASELKKIVDALSPREREKLKFKARKAKELGVIP